MADPVADICILTAPVQTEHSIAARITISGSEATPKFAHVFDFSCDFYFCSVPAFSVGAITVGFCTQEPAKDASSAAINHMPIGSERVRCNRYVRDDEKGVFLMLAENSKTGVTEIDCMSHRSARKRTRILARFDTVKLRKNLKSARGILHPSDISGSLSYLSVAHERRKCPLCGATDNGECGCVLPFKRPMHPLDFRNERRNMSLHTGRYEGESVVRLFDNMKPFIITSLGTKSVIKGSVDRNVISRLNKYAVQDRMAKLGTNPFAWLMPGLSSLPGMNSAVSSSMESIDFGNILNDLGNNRLLPTPEAGFLQTADKMGGFNELDGNEMDLMIDGMSRNELNGSGMGFLGLGGVEAAGQETREVVAVPEEEAVDDDGVDFGDECIDDDGDADMRVQKKRRVGLAEMDEKERKAELRRERNRMAAAKSNIKRKKRNEILRRDLKEVNERASELRAAEKRLRQENVRLRRLAHEHKVRVSAHLTHIQISNEKV